MAPTPSRRSTTRRLRLWPLLATVAIVACGGDSTSSPSSTSSSSGTPPTPTEAPPSSTSAPVVSSTDATTTPTTTLTTTPTTTPPATSTPEDPMTTDAPVPDDVIASDVVQAAIDDLVERTGADRSAIEVASVGEVEWPDGSLGCPQPGMSYTQAIVNGTKIVLRLDGFPYDYHQGGSRPVFYCPPGDVSR